MVYKPNRSQIPSILADDLHGFYISVNHAASASGKIDLATNYADRQ